MSNSSRHRGETPGGDRPVEQQGGHWLLASVGKKVLRPGGRETTDWLLERVDPAGAEVVELAPGMGVTAREILARGPARYTGVEEDPVACRTVAALLPEDGAHRVIRADAAATGLPAGGADIVLGEAMLTMQGAKGKARIMAEAARLLRPGGVYAIHEMSLAPDDLPGEVARDIRVRLAKVIRVNARPLTLPEWREAAEAAGFTVADTFTTSMSLLEPRRLLADEGPAGVARMAFNLARRPEVRRRVLAMRSVFRDHAGHLRGAGLILRKGGES